MQAGKGRFPCDPRASALIELCTPGPLGLNKGAIAGRGRLLASADTAPAQGETPAAKGESSADIQAVIAALDAGRLHADLNDVKGQLRGIAAGGSWTGKVKVDKEWVNYDFRACPALVKLLAGLLAEGATMTLMSLFRFNPKKEKNPHGTLQADGSVLGRAVDIMVYNGHKIHLKNPENASDAIAGVAAVISHMPAGLYQLGLPRPVGGDHMDPEHDVFLPVTDLGQRQKSPKGGIQKHLEALLEPARTEIRNAIAGNSRARFQCLYPDGVDHLHITVLS
jgi:hypothetical protein